LLIIVEHWKCTDDGRWDWVCCIGSECSFSL